MVSYCKYDGCKLWLLSLLMAINSGYIMVDDYISVINNSNHYSLWLCLSSQKVIITLMSKWWLCNGYTMGFYNGYIYNGFWELYYEYHSVIMMLTEDNKTILVLMI